MADEDDKAPRRKKPSGDDALSKERVKAVREFVTGPNLKWLVGLLVVLLLVLASVISGVGFSVSEGGIVFGVTNPPPAGNVLPVEPDGAVGDTADVAAEDEAPPVEDEAPPEP